MSHNVRRCRRASRTRARARALGSVLSTHQRIFPRAPHGVSGGAGLAQPEARRHAAARGCALRVGQGRAFRLDVVGKRQRAADARVGECAHLVPAERGRGRHTLEAVALRQWQGAPRAHPAGGRFSSLFDRPCERSAVVGHGEGRQVCPKHLFFPIVVQRLFVDHLHVPQEVALATDPRALPGCGGLCAAG